MSDNNKILEKSIKNLRENLDSLSMDKFITTTIESLMNIERDEHLEKINNPKIDKGNGYKVSKLFHFNFPHEYQTPALLHQNRSHIPLFWN